MIHGQINRHPVTSVLYPPKKGPLFGENEFVLLRQVEVRHALVVRFQPRTVDFIIRKTRERDQPKCNVVSSLMRHPVAKQIAAAFRNDREPLLRIGFEQMPLERIELVANEDGNGHELLPFEKA